ncbi:proton-conducting membrane transporter [Pleomorphomonas diazotrophica]|uniref:Proton-conducting membrane transporter n=1 Tax=Pleomorphomonas diazotrophica TaxID=1166257 RepID=A0A1I4RLU7_9HYPH|nr:NADH-quinone oxidoreductase subunit C [Pleomorphomonas diazotrophica]PKR87483.1 proton-conducting membrane transporter [Pleomorphomonas diazotrophica]SFM53204.1 Respiratory-chain NADH dehydrogenase, subunit [Pleomorphomonas diazotrophica]
MSRLPQDLEARLTAAAPAGVEFSAETDQYGVTVAWLGLASAADLSPVAALLKDMGARLSMITCAQPSVPEEEEDEDEENEDGEAKAEAEPKETPKTFGGTPLDGTSYEIDYHFDIAGDALTIIAYVPQGGSIPSLTPLFRNADWHEREMMELYAVKVTDHPDPRRLFLDASVDGAVLERLIPFSTLVNAASTKGLWERLTAAGKKGAA